MPYDLTTKDGLVTIKNVPDNVDPNSDEMRQRVALERSKFAEQQPEKSFIDRASDLVSSNPVLGNIGDVGNAEDGPFSHQLQHTLHVNRRRRQQFGPFKYLWLSTVSRSFQIQTNICRNIRFTVRVMHWK